MVPFPIQIGEISDREKNKRSNEIQHLESFLQKLNNPIILCSNFDSLDAPEPDFLLYTVDNRHIGLELISLVDSSKKSFESDLKKKVVREFEKHIEEYYPSFKGQINIHPNIKIWQEEFYQNRKFLNKDFYHEILQELIKTIDQIKILELTCNKTLNFKNLFDFEKTEYVNSISILKGKNKLFISIAGGGGLQNVQKYNIDSKKLDLIQKAIEDKECKPKNYKCRYDELWLLIYATENGMASIFDFDNYENLNYSSKFDRVFLKGNGDVYIVKSNN